MIPRSLDPSRRAFTLVELLVVIAIMALLLSIAGVSWKTMSDDRREFNALNSIKGALRAARARAMELSSDVAVIYDHNGVGRLYVHAPLGHPRHIAALDAGPNLNPDDQFVPDQGINVARLEQGLLAARLSFADPGTNAGAAALAGTPDQPLNERAFHVAFCFDSAGRLRRRPITAVLPSLDLSPQRIVVLAGEGTLVNALYGRSWNDIDKMSEVGCVVFQQSAAPGSLRVATPLAQVQDWLHNEATDTTNGATLVINEWTGRPLATAEQ